MLERTPNMDCFRSVASLSIAMALACAGCGQAPQPQTDAHGEPSLSGSTAVDELHPKVVLATSLGDMTVRLDAERAPLTVANFLRYVDEGAYDETIFHEVQRDFIALGGGFRANLVERPAGLAVRNEADNGLKNTRGTIAMARQAEVIDSATSHFFLNLADNPALDYRGRSAQEYGYCAFGEVIDGQNVLSAIGGAPVTGANGFDKLPVTPIAIRSIRRVR